MIPYSSLRIPIFKSCLLVERWRATLRRAWNGTVYELSGDIRRAQGSCTETMGWVKMKEISMSMLTFLNTRHDLPASSSLVDSCANTGLEEFHHHKPCMLLIARRVLRLPNVTHSMCTLYGLLLLIWSNCASRIPVQDFFWVLLRDVAWLWPVLYYVVLMSNPSFCHAYIHIWFTWSVWTNKIFEVNYWWNSESSAIYLI